MCLNMVCVGRSLRPITFVQCFIGQYIVIKFHNIQCNALFFQQRLCSFQNIRMRRRRSTDFQCYCTICGFAFCFFLCICVSWFTWLCATTCKPKATTAVNATAKNFLIIPKPPPSKYTYHLFSFICKWI